MDNKSPEAFRTISEVAEWLGVPTHVLRFWESRFAQVKPVKRAGGRRYYRPADMELLGGIRKLLHEDGMTIRGVQKLLREKGVRHVAALSPSIDEPADLRMVGGSNVVEFAGRRDGAGLEAEIEDAVEVGDDDEQVFAVDAQSDETGAAEATKPGEEPAFAPFFEAEGATGGDAETAAAEPAFVAAAAEGPLSGPEAMDFFAHEAPPETVEDAADHEPPHRPDEPGADWLEEDAEADAFDSPEAMDFFAHEAPPETVEDAAAEDSVAKYVFAEDADTSEQVAPDAAEAAEAEPAPVEAKPVPAAAAPRAPATERPALVLPVIGRDPEDDAAFELPPATAVRLRRHRAGAGATVNAAVLQAFADRLDELSGRLGHTPDRRRPF